MRQAWQRPHPPLLALERGREGQRRVGAARPGRPGEQPGVGHPAARPTASRRASIGRRCPTRVSQTLTGRLPAGPGRAAGDPGPHRVGDLVDRQPGVEHEVVLGVGRGQLGGTPRGPARGTRPTRPRSGRAPRNGPGRARGARSSTHGQVRPQVVGRPPGHRLDLVDVERPAGPLVGEGRVDVAVGDHHLAPPRAPGSTTVSTCSALSAAYSSASVRSDERAGGRVEHDPAQLPADLGVARLEGEHDGVPLRLEPRPQRPRLRGLAGALAALEAHEDPRGGVVPVTGAGGWGARRLGARRLVVEQGSSSGRRVDATRSHRRPPRRPVAPALLSRIAHEGLMTNDPIGLSHPDVSELPWAWAPSLRTRRSSTHGSGPATGTSWGVEPVLTESKEHGRK